MSSAHFWLEKYHIDGLRVDAVASMLYLDYGRKHGEWIPNAYGGKENLDAIEFLKQLNIAVGRDFPDTRSIAEESTSWPSVSRPVFTGGLGFSMKWNMGWMHDTLDYFQHDPSPPPLPPQQPHLLALVRVQRELRLPLSHDEVVYGQEGARREDARAMRGSSSPTCGSSSATCGRIPGRSSSSWGGRSRSGANGTTSASSTGSSRWSPATPACSAGSRT
jgi:1,4-alpha-glucan branching enzyme